MKIEITESMKRIATDIEETIKSSPKIKGRYSNYALDEDRRFYNGALGELAFFGLLKQNGKKAYFKPSLIGADNGDITVYLPESEIAEGYPIALDVKTASQAHYKCLMLPRKQYEKYKRTAYIAVRIDNDIAEVLGYCYHNDLVDVSTLGIKPKVATMGILIESLKPIEDVLGKIIKGKATVDLSNIQELVL